MRFVSLLAMVTVVTAAGSASADGPRLTLEQLTARAQAGPRATMTRSESDAARAPA
jgi:hypothetical protein